MSDLTVPGSIPGLLRRGSPVVIDGRERAVYCGMFSDEKACCTVAEPGRASHPNVPLGRVALDLTDPTGRAHAAWWLLGCMGWEDLERVVCDVANEWDPSAWLDWFLTDDDQKPNHNTIDSLRLVVLHVAGVTP